VLSQIEKLSTGEEDQYSNQVNFVSNTEGPSIQTRLSAELDRFEANCGRGVLFTRAYNNLKGIPPSTIEPERSFSISGRFINKFRTSMSDTMLDDLVILQNYFKNFLNNLC
jgi:hypothetical protein